MPKAKPAPSGAVRIQYEDLDGLREFPGNPKLHDDVMLDRSINEFGFADPIMVDETTGWMVKGHGRRNRLKAMKAAGDPPPARIEVRDGRWFVPVVRGVGFKDRREAERYLIADNQITMLGGWDTKELAAFMGSFASQDLVGTGFSEKDLVRFIAQAPPGGGSTDPDVAPELPRRAVARRGDLWILGDHRLVCGDATDKAVVARVMDGAKAALLATDPPYGVDYSKTKNGIPDSGFRDHTRTWGDMEGDDVDGEALQGFLESVIRTALSHVVKSCAYYLWHPMLTQGTFFAAAAAAADILIHRQLVWVKPGFVLTRSGMYHWRHELCFYGWVRGNMPPWFGEKNQTSIIMAGRDEDSGQHPTQKPVVLFEIPMQNHVEKGGVCYEPFCGSGSQIIAAERLGRRCNALEIEPRWVDVAVERWQSFTGKKAQRVRK